MPDVRTRWRMELAVDEVGDVLPTAVEQILHANLPICDFLYLRELSY